MTDAGAWPVVEIFASMQGEGANTGRPAVFLRLGGCNLACPWCDTDFRRFRRLPLPDILEEIRACAPGCRSVVVTGGEPFIHKDIARLLRALKGRGYWLAAETNGLEAPDAETLGLLDYVAVSPKALFAGRYDEARMLRGADEVRIVVDGEIAGFCERMRAAIRARLYFLSPCERGGRIHFEEAVRLLGVLNRVPRRPPWLLSVQAHKLAGFR